MIGFLNKMEMCGTIKSITSPLQKSHSFCTPSRDQYQSNLGKGRIRVPFAEGTCAILHAKMSRCALSCWVCSVTPPTPPCDGPGTAAIGAHIRHMKHFSSPALLQNSDLLTNWDPSSKYTAFKPRGVNSLLNHSLPSAEMTQTLHPSTGSAPGWGIWNTGSGLGCTKSRALHRWRLQHCSLVLKSRDTLTADQKARQIL